ncbi:hypothetical protein [Gynuella sunshinyii]|uniref:DUF4129 domain-containing protein n=1 Tax=Gynuella sunshinyii YC6258 TaxID=1445510 RepID=A0A0C5VS98_9GAMM|nr:hypothetical protein [Gynuella sunshinyii]AJQ97096.1 hypothetical Protein YC6258_05066 [Gynuella sunshinyii YC6258]
MSPADIVFTLRARDRYEAIDLGFHLVRRWWRQLYLLWLIWMVPVAFISFWLLPEPYYAGLLIWWLKPMFERSQLYFLSRAVFGEVPGIRETLRQTPKMLRIQWFASLTWRRLSTTRSFDLPIIQLEGQKGAARKKRLGVLHQGQAGTAASWLTIVGIHIESFSSFALIALMMMVLPQNMELDWKYLLDATFLQFIATVIAIALIGPFYVAGGFALYLNRRIILEGWDLELMFQQMTQRMQPEPQRHNTAGLAGLVAVLALTLIFSAAPKPAQAAELTPESAREDIQTIMQGPDFHTLKTSRIPKFLDDRQKEQKELDEPTPPDFDFDGFSGLESLALIFKLLLWGLLISCILSVLYRYRDALLTISLPARKNKSISAAPTHLFELDIREQSLPDELVTEAVSLWQRQAYREALALLYRGGLSRLVNQHDLRLSRGATEEDCVALVTTRESRELSTYFAQLTQAWQTQAYAHQQPESVLFNQLCKQWDAHFGHRQGETHEP